MSAILFVCTGNAARSVMAGAMFAQLAPGWAVLTAGTHVIEGQPMSRRTAAALDSLGIAPPAHRSRQVTPADLRAADVVVAFERFHVTYIRSLWAPAAERTSTLPELVRRLELRAGPLEDRVALLRLGDDDPADLEEVDDPAGADLEVVTACARVILQLSLRLVAALGGGAAGPLSSETLSQGPG